MSWEIISYAAIAFFATLLSGMIAAVAWRQRETPGSKALSLLMLAGAEWSFAAGLESLAIGIPAKVFWSQVEYLGAAFVGPLFFVFVLQYIRLDRAMPTRRLAFLFIVPALTLLLTWTNEWHHLIWTGFRFSSNNNNILIYEHGLWFFIGHIGYAYVLMFVGTVLLIWAVLRARQLYRAQGILLLAGAVSPWVGVTAYVFGLTPILGLDWSAIAVAPTGLLWTLGIVRLHLFDLVPVARDALVEDMRDGVLVLDTQNRIVDLNPAAQQFIGPTATSALGQPAENVLAAYPDLIARVRDMSEGQTELVLDAEVPRYFDLRISLLREPHGRTTGRLIIWHEITRLKQAENSLQQANTNLQAQLVTIQALQAGLREQAIRDALTGLFNRRYLEETFERELGQAGRKGDEVGVVMMDIDHFKAFNDRYGHRAGDELLRATGYLLRTLTRQGDIACRYGGEEFVVVMIGASLEIAQQRAEEWRAAFDALRVDFGGEKLHATLSLGVAEFPAHGENADEMLQCADQALYAAKLAGRNCARVYAPPETEILNN